MLRHSAGSNCNSRQHLQQQTVPSHRVFFHRTGRKDVQVQVTGSEVEQVDPMTGEVLTASSVGAPVAGLNLQAGRHTWAYRRNQVDPSVVKQDVAPALLLHGLGSSSYCYRSTLSLLGGAGFEAIAPDWIGHGNSDKPATTNFDYTEEAYIAALGEFVAAAGLKQPFPLVVHGFILGQYGLLYALQHPEQISRLLILNTPVSRTTKLRPELAAYKAPLPFMRPGNKPFNGAYYNAGGSPYMMEQLDAQAYSKPYDDSPAATAAISATMDKVDFQKLLNKVDQGFLTWRTPTVLLFGGSDPFIEFKSAFDFVEDKRTNIKVLNAAAKLGHMPQEDYAAALQDLMVKWLVGGTDETDMSKPMLKMSKKGVVEL